MKYQLPLVAFALTIAVTDTTGCGNSAENAQEKVIEQALAQDGVGAKVDLKANGSVSYTATDKSGSSFSAGENVALPADFPKDLPTVEGWTLQLVTTEPDTHT